MSGWNISRSPDMHSRIGRLKWKTETNEPLSWCGSRHVTRNQYSYKVKYLLSMGDQAVIIFQFSAYLRTRKRAPLWSTDKPTEPSLINCGQLSTVRDERNDSHSFVLQVQTIKLAEAFSIIDRFSWLLTRKQKSQSPVRVLLLKIRW